MSPRENSLMDAGSPSVSRKTQGTRKVANASPGLAMSAKSGQDLYRSMISKKVTRKWKMGEGKHGNLSYEKMRATINQRHPRVLVDGEQKEIPLCVSTGRLITSSNRELFGLDDMGVAVSIYFKLLKSLINLFMIFCLLYSPIYYLYSCGSVSDQASSTL